jgi:hypothetical protein
MPLWLFLTLPLAGMVASLGLRLVLAAAPLPFWPRVVAGTLGVALALAGGGEIVVGALLVRRYVRAEVGRGR